MLGDCPIHPQPQPVMSVIRILPEDISNRIAAGEVIERPASLVKELVENSLDAGATRISIQVERGGRSLIRVIDDGCGMDPEDALMCLEQHATSKVKDARDIEAICTLGFRGEALPSIASVTRFTLVTRPHDADAGTEVEVDGGKIRSVQATGCAPGTAITARNLFYNMPARRKFLRGIATEEGYIQEMVLLQALAHPTVGIELTFDRRPVVSVQPGKDLATRATMLLGRDIMAAMLPVAYEAEDIRVSGFVARPGLTRGTRREQRSFVNGRPVDSVSVYTAIRDAYNTMVMKGRYPPTLLFLELDPERMDINVHPAKKEVRFREEHLVNRVVGAAVRQALRGLLGQTGDFGSPGPQQQARGFERDRFGGSGSRPAAAPAPARRPPPDLSLHPEAVPETPMQQPPLLQRPLAAPPAALRDSQPLRRPAAAPIADAAPAADVERPDAPADDAEHQDALDRLAASAGGTSISVASRQQIAAMRVIGDLGNLFLLAEGPTGLVLIDQHAAHERVMFELLMDRAAKRDGASQGLLLPVTVELSVTDATLLRRHLQLLQDLGFGVEEFGGNAFLVNAVPPHFPQDNIAGQLREILDDLRESSHHNRRLDEHAVATAACKAAVKAHDPLKPAEVQQLLRSLAGSELPYTCPHGRPTMISISFGELERRFGRRH